VEELDRPDLKSKPMAVGGMGMITTANYEVQRQQQRIAAAVHGSSSAWQQCMAAAVHGSSARLQCGVADCGEAVRSYACTGLQLYSAASAVSQRS
jgi:hypothetical protein